MIWKDWRTGDCHLRVLPLILISTWIFRDRVRDANRRIRNGHCRINAFLQEHISGMGRCPIVQSGTKIKRAVRGVESPPHGGVKDAILAFAIFFPAVELFSTTAIAIVLWYGGLRSFAGLVTSARWLPSSNTRSASSSDPGPEREIQHPAIGHGGRASASSNCSTNRCRRRQLKLLFR